MLLVVIAACYKPAAETSCGVRCASDGTCPGSLHCGDDGLCHDESGTTCGGGTDAPPQLDAPADAAIDTPPGCYGGHLGVTLCNSDAPLGTYNPLTGIDTTTGIGCTAVKNNFCVVAAQNVDFNQDVAVYGGRPIIFFASGTLTVEPGVLIDVASKYGALPGPGSNPLACSAAINGGAEDGTYGAGGGAGGTLRGGGGVGGNGASSNGTGSNGAQPDTPLAGVSALRGGCRGGDGGGCTSFTSGGIGGNGGGAVYFLAGQLLEMKGMVNASGAGGGPGETTSACGGGGGGSGGLIVLDAPMVTFDNAVLLASGGGGGGSYNSGAASSGSDPAITAPRAAALGGTGDPGGSGDGGNGSSQSSLPGLSGVAGARSTGFTGGGGGGGGAGFIWDYCHNNSYTGTNTMVPDLQVK